MVRCSFTIDHGLPDNDAEAVEIDPDASLYAGTDHDVSPTFPTPTRGSSEATADSRSRRTVTDRRARGR